MSSDLDVLTILEIDEDGVTFDWIYKNDWLHRNSFKEFLKCNNYKPLQARLNPERLP